MEQSRLGFTLLFILITPIVLAQVNRYVITFKDKTNSPFNIDSPLQFLSQKAIDRRAKQGISITEQDLPVKEEYIEGIRDAGADVFFKTRWMNGVLIQCNVSLVSTIEALSYVDVVLYVAPNATLMGNGRKMSVAKNQNVKADLSETQLAMVGIDHMHADGFKGEGITIAIFDDGFQGVNTAAPFQTIFSENRIDLNVSHDFVFNSDNVFQYDSHGTNVFSVIAAHQDGVFTGGAYGARYQLYVTEDVDTEYRVEEFNWLFAAERADSAGVDVINSSLGYYDFDDASMNYDNSDMDGVTTVVSRAAQWAADKGIAVICSAGNEGSNAWQIITAPADAKDVLAVASVTSERVRAGSSSKGPSADNRIKPDVAGMGGSTRVILPSGSVGTVSGTSLASPIITSLVAGVWQRYPTLTSKEILEVIRRSGSQASEPDSLLGYGIPDYERIETIMDEIKKNPFMIYPNPVKDSLIIKLFNAGENVLCNAEIISIQGQLMIKKELNFSTQNPTSSIDLSNQAAGAYILRIQCDNQIFMHKLIKQF